MGIRGLQSYLESSERRFCCYTVDITKLAQDYSAKHKKTPVIVVDGQSCLSIWLKHTDSFSGLQVAKFLQILLRFVNAFENAGIKLVFYFGGNTVDKKRKVWISRRFREVKRLEYMFNQLRRNIPMSGINTTEIVTPHLSTFAMLILRHYTNCEVYVTIDEADTEIMKYAHNNRCFAILAQDSDFVIAQGDYYYLSAKHLNIDNMTTLIYDGKRLAEYLNIPTDKLPLLASLVGNDFVQFDELSIFHSMIRESASIITDVATYIKTLPKNMNQIDFLKHIASQVFRDSAKYTVLIASMDSYSLIDTDDTAPVVDEWSKIVSIARNRHINLRNATGIWSVINCELYECGTGMEDFRPGYICIQPACKLLRNLRQRLYGILLMQKPGDRKQIKEWVVESKTSCEKPTLVTPVYPNAEHPGLVALWTEPPQVSNTIRWNLFLETVYGYVPPDIRAWKTLRPCLVLPVASLRFLKDTGELHDFELYSLLATVLECSRAFPRPTNANSDVYPDIRALHISTLFFRTFVLFYSIMGACGYPIPWGRDTGIVTFDGQLFQYNYRKASSESYSWNLPHYREIVDILFTNFEMYFENAAQRRMQI